MRTPSVVATLSAAALLAACGEPAGSDVGSPGTCAATTTVTLFDFGFVPPCVTIAPGATVTFENADTNIHTVTSYSTQDAFDSHLLSPGQQFSHTFRSGAGKIFVYCSLHPGTMAMVVIE